MKIFMALLEECEDLLEDYVYRLGKPKTEVYRNFGLTSKQVNNILRGEVYNCFDFIMTVHFKCLGVPDMLRLYNALHEVTEENPRFFISRNILVLFELAALAERKSEFFDLILSKKDLTTAQNETIQVIVDVEHMYANVTKSNIQRKLSGYNRIYYSFMLEDISSDIDMVISEDSFLSYCLSLRKIERSAQFFFSEKYYENARNLYEIIYERAFGKYHLSYLGFRIMQCLYYIKDDVAFENYMRRHFTSSHQQFKEYLEQFMKQKYYYNDSFLSYLELWFRHDKIGLLENLEKAETNAEMATVYLLLGQITKKVVYTNLHLLTGS